MNTCPNCGDTTAAGLCGTCTQRVKDLRGEVGGEPTAKDRERVVIDEHVEAFKRAGGRIVHVEIGTSGMAETGITKEYQAARLKMHEKSLAARHAKKGRVKQSTEGKEA